MASQKLDPYVNVDPGTMSPLQHGEVFVTCLLYTSDVYKRQAIDSNGAVGHLLTRSAVFVKM